MRNKLKAQLTRSVAAAILTASLAACGPRQPQPPAADTQAAKPAPRPSLPIVEPPINRARMLFAVARAASSHASGADDAEAQRMLDGKQFEIRLRFGCDGQGPAAEGHGWSIDPDGRTLRLRVVPNLSLDDELVASVSAEGIEAAEGFWLSRPWLLYAACPTEAALADSAAPEGERESSEGGKQANSPSGTMESASQRIGIAQFFTSDDPRTLRRMNRPFEAVKQLKEGEIVGQQGFNLVLSGRLRSRGDGRVILCAGSGRDRSPDCIVSARIDRVWIERPEDQSLMAEWSV